ncbi:MAG: hypothetical protein K6T86_21780 [Pirellulales bacterium]|nr:hypothetical protein [Pirellulales bacterium]
MTVDELVRGVNIALGMLPVSVCPAMDANGDGQIAMSEFATTWTDAKVEEFMRYDLNGDGIITAAECQATAPPPKR